MYPTYLNLFSLSVLKCYNWKYDILNVYDAYKLEVGVLMYKYFIGLLPKNFDSLFAKRSDIHDYRTRKSNDFNQTRNKKYLLIKLSEQLDPFCGSLILNI